MTQRQRVPEVPKFLPKVSLGERALTFDPGKDPALQLVQVSLAGVLMSLGLLGSATVGTFFLAVLLFQNVILALGVAAAVVLLGLLATVLGTAVFWMWFRTLGPQRLTVRPGEVQVGGKPAALAPVHVVGEPGGRVRIEMGPKTLASWPWHARPPLEDILWMADTVGGLAGVERVNTCDSAAWDAYPAKLQERRREHLEAEVASSQTNFAHLHQIPASTISSTQAFDAVTYRSNLLLDANSHYARCEFTVQHQGLTIGARLIPLQEIERVVVVYEETPMRTDMAGSVRIMLTGGLSISVARGTLQISSLSDVCGQLNGVAAVLASYVGGASLEKGSTEEIPEGLRKLRSTVRGC